MRYYVEWNTNKGLRPIPVYLEPSLSPITWSSHWKLERKDSVFRLKCPRYIHFYKGQKQLIAVKVEILNYGVQIDVIFLSV